MRMPTIVSNKATHQTTITSKKASLGHLMAKITFTGKQYVVTIPKDLVELMGWSRDTKVIISKFPDKDILFVEEIKNRK